MRGHKPKRMSLRDEAPKHATVHQTPQMWRVVAGPATVPEGGAGARPWYTLAAPTTVSDTYRTSFQAVIFYVRLKTLQFQRPMFLV